MRAQLVLPFAALAWLAAGCTEPGVTTTPVPAAVPPTTSVTSESYYEEGDPEPHWPTAIHSYSSDIILPQSDATYPAAALLGGYMYYDGYHARISGRANVTGPNTAYHDFYPKNRDTFWSFFNKGFHAQWTFYVGGACGNVVDASLLYETWWMYRGGWSADHQRRDDKAERRQPSCATSGGGGTGDGGGGETVRCYTYTQEHYWYYPDTGEYEYRYTTEEQWCESTS